MTAYSKQDLFNLYMQEQLSEAFHYKCISDETYKTILAKHSHKLYTPNYFIRIGLALLSIVAVIFSVALLLLVVGLNADSGVSGLLIFCAISCYGFLELLVKNKRFYNAGIDNVLLVMISLFILSAFVVQNGFNDNYQAPLITISVVCAWFCIRFTDAFMAVISFVTFLGFVFLLYIQAGAWAIATAPFLIMLMCVLFFVTAKKSIQNKNMFAYKKCMQWLAFVALVCFYIAGNFYVVNELSITMFNMLLPFGSVYWIFTFLVPVCYILYGVKKRERLFYRTGIALLILSVLTVRYYYTVMPAEVAMLVFGGVIVIIAIVVIKYLKTAKHGYKFENIDQPAKNILNAEALIIAEVFGKKQIPQSTATTFGGGSSGGAGATGNY